VAFTVVLPMKTEVVVTVTFDRVLDTDIEGALVTVELPRLRAELVRLAIAVEFTT